MSGGGLGKLLRSSVGRDAMWKCVALSLQQHSPDDDDPDHVVHCSFVVSVINGQAAWFYSIIMQQEQGNGEFGLMDPFR